MRRIYYAHISGAGWIRELHVGHINCTPYFDKALPLLSGVLTDLPPLVAMQFKGYRLRIIKVEYDQETP